MGEAETGGVFEAVAKQPIHANVVEPDQGEGQLGRMAKRDCDNRQRRGKYVGVDGVVGIRPPTRPGKISEHGEIGNLPEGGEEPPIRANMRVEGGAQRSYGQPLESKPTEHRRRYCAACSGEGFRGDHGRLYLYCGLIEVSKP